MKQMRLNFFYFIIENIYLIFTAMIILVCWSNYGDIENLKVRVQAVILFCAISVIVFVLGRLLFYMKLEKKRKIKWL